MTISQKLQIDSFLQMEQLLNQQKFDPKKPPRAIISYVKKKTQKKTVLSFLLET